MADFSKALTNLLGAGGSASFRGEQAAPAGIFNSKGPNREIEPGNGVFPSIANKAVAFGDMPMIDPNLGTPRPRMGGNFLPTEMQSDYLYSPSAMKNYLDYANEQNWAYNSAPEYKDVPLWRIDPSAPAMPIDEWATQIHFGNDNVVVPNVRENKRAKKNEGK